jgi:hypothetical protein
MPSALSQPSSIPARSPRPKIGSSPRSDRAHAGREHAVRRHDRPLASYTDADGRPREVLARAGWAGSVLVVDRDAATLGDRRLVAHLAADEPAQNAVLVCESYLRQLPSGRHRCRALTPQDLQTSPLADDVDGESPATPALGAPGLRDRFGRLYSLERLATGMSIPELRWCRRSPGGEPGERESLSMREVIAATESYEPALTLTRRALAHARGQREVSTSVLRVELMRAQESPIVLNRRLREVALAIIERHGTSMSEIAIRCGRVKRDGAGNESGETSWLARRLGIMPEGGKDAPTPWIHSDVLALIARRGLGVSPREVEVQ